MDVTGLARPRTASFACCVDDSMACVLGIAIEYLVACRTWRPRAGWGAPTPRGIPSLGRGLGLRPPEAPGNLSRAGEGRSSRPRGPACPPPWPCRPGNPGGPESPGSPGGSGAPGTPGGLRLRGDPGAFHLVAQACSWAVGGRRLPRTYVHSPIFPPAPRRTRNGDKNPMVLGTPK